MPGVTVELYEDLDNDGWLDSSDRLVTTDVTGVSGYYEFGGLEEGNYLVVETDLANFVSTGDKDSFGNPNSCTNNGNATVDCNVIDIGSIGIGTSSTLNHFFDEPINDPEVSGTVYDDLNSNGAYDVGEPGLANAVITVVGVGSDTTDANGLFAITVPGPDNYTVTETDPSGYISTGAFAGTHATVSDHNTIDLTLSSGQSSSGNIFLDTMPPEPEDECPNTPPGGIVDDDGCGFDTDLTVDKSSDATTGKVGQAFNYIVTISNSGAEAHNVVMEDEVPSVLTINGTPSATNGGTCAVDGQVVTCTWPILDDGSSGIATISVTLNQPSIVQI